jgi:hypothetical protein
MRLNPRLVAAAACLMTTITAGFYIATGSGPAQTSADSAPFGCPQFHFKDGTTHCAGKAFAIAWFHNRRILLAPLHLLGPGAGNAGPPKKGVAI